MISTPFAITSLSALCFVGLSPELRAVAFSSNAWGGMAFLLMSMQLFDLRKELRDLLPWKFGGTLTAVIFLCGLHHVLDAASLLINLARFDAIVVGLMALGTSAAAAMLLFEVPGWIITQRKRLDG